MPDDGVKIVEEEKIPLKDKSWYEGEALDRHLKKVFVYFAVCVLATGLPFMGYLAVYGTPEQQAWTSHMLAAIFGAAAGTLWTTMHPKR